MHIGQNCLVRYPVPGRENRYKWWKAVIKSVEGETLTVIWGEGEWRGEETDKLPLDLILARDDISSVREDIAEVKQNVKDLADTIRKDIEKKKPIWDMFMKKLDGVSTRLDILNGNLQRHWAMHNVVNYDEVNFDEMRASLNSLGSVHMYSRTNSPNVEEVRRYTSAPELPVFGNYNKKQ
jgi:hypothetical protein